jgi:hypothetical protein
MVAEPDARGDPHVLAQSALSGLYSSDVQAPEHGALLGSRVSLVAPRGDKLQRDVYVWEAVSR